MEITLNNKKVKMEIIKGIVYINTTQHPINMAFNDNSDEVYVIPQSGLFTNAKSIHKIVSKKCVKGIEFVETSFEKDNLVKEELDILRNMFHDRGYEVIIIGSMVAAQAYGSLVKALTPCTGYEKVNETSKKRMRLDKFIIFPRV